MTPYAATDGRHDPETCPVAAGDLIEARGIEVGHIFYFGTRYSKPLGCAVTLPGGERRPLHGGSYGIGISRLAGAIIEACHDEAGIVWPDAVAPFAVGLINLKSGDGTCDALADKIERKLAAAGVETLHDDRDERAGVKFADMDLIGLPWQLAVGPRGARAGRVELKRRADGSGQELAPDDAIGRILGSGA